MLSWPTTVLNVDCVFALIKVNRLTDTEITIVTFTTDLFAFCEEKHTFNLS